MFKRKGHSLAFSLLGGLVFKTQLHKNKDGKKVLEDFSYLLCIAGLSKIPNKILNCFHKLKKKKSLPPKSRIPRLCLWILVIIQRRIDTNSSQVLSKMKRRECFQTHLTRTALPWYQNQTRTPQEIKL